MIGLQRRKQSEGWTAEVTQMESQGSPNTFRQRLGDDNKIWLIAAGVIIIFAFWIILHTQDNNDVEITPNRQAVSANINYNDQSHREWAAKFIKNKSYCAAVIDGGFTGPGVFKIVMPSSASADDIDYTSKMAARLIEHDLRERASIHTYFRKMATGAEWEAAVTEWNQLKEHGGYTMKLVGDAK